jgi:hypothetical protein
MNTNCSMNLLRIKRICAEVHGSAAVPAVLAAVCNSVYGNMCAVCAEVFLVGYGSVHSSVRLSGSVWQCAAVCGSVCVYV